MAQFIDNIKYFWNASGKLQTKFYFKPAGVIMGGLWLFAIGHAIFHMFRSATKIMEFIMVTIYGIPFILFFLFLVYVSFRFYPWVIMMLSQLPLTRRVFKFNTSLLDSLLDGFREAKASVDYNVPAMVQREYYNDPFTGELRQGRTRTNNMQRLEEMGLHLLDNYIIKPFIRLFLNFAVFPLSCLLGWIAIPYVLKRI